MLTKEGFLMIGIFFLATCLKEILSLNVIEEGTHEDCPPAFATAEVLFCNGACGDDWLDDVAGCQAADADAYCKLKNCDEHAFASSFTDDDPISITDDEMTPGFACEYGKENLDADFDKYEGTWFGIEDVHFSSGTAETHGNGQVVRNVVCGTYRWVETSVVTCPTDNCVETAGEIDGTTCSTDERYDKFLDTTLDECQSMAESLGYNFIYFQRADERPQNRDLCHIYWSCEEENLRIPAETGTNYELVTVQV